MPQTVHWLTFKFMQGSTSTHGQVAKHPVLGLAPAEGADNEGLTGGGTIIGGTTGGVTTGGVTTGKRCGGGKAGW